MIAALVSICTGAIALFFGYRIGRADGLKRAAFEESWKKAGGK